MCLQFLYYLCCINNYEDVTFNLEFDNPMDEAIHIIQINEPDLIIRYSYQGVIIFNKEYFLWYNRLHKEAFEFMSRFKPPQLDYTSSQLVYLCRIPEEYQEEFLNVIKREYS